MTVQDHFVDVDGKNLFVRIWTPEESEARSPIILFHDSLGCVELWRGFPAALSDATQRTVIAYDRYGYGKSDAKPVKQPLDFVSEEADIYIPALIQQLDIERFIAFGHSVGGGMAVHCAAKFPESCEALITEAAQAFVERRTRAGILEAQIMFADENNVERLKKYHGEKARWVLDAWIDTWLSEAFSNWNLKGVLPQVQCPLLAIHGSEDEFGSVKHPEIIREYTGGESRMEILSGLKHVPHREDEERVIGLVLDFLAMHDR